MATPINPNLYPTAQTQQITTAINQTDTQIQAQTAQLTQIGQELQALLAGNTTTVTATNTAPAAAATTTEANTTDTEAGGKGKYEGLPPGIQRQMDSGKRTELPPGLAKKFGDQEADATEANQAGEEATAAQPDLMTLMNNLLEGLKGLVGQREALVETLPANTAATDPATQDPLVAQQLQLVA